MGRWLRAGLALLLGVAAFVGVGAALFFATRSLWGAYMAAEADKAFSLSMLLVRLLIGALCTAAGGVVATWVARDQGRIAWVLGALLLALSLRPHLVTVWDDYPLWYHLVYLGYLVPVAGLGGRLLVSMLEGGSPAASSAAT